MQKQKGCSSQLGVKLKSRQRPQLVSCCGSLVASSVLSVCFRASGVCRQMQALSLYREPFPIRTTKLAGGTEKESRQHEFIKTFTHYHMSFFSGHLYIRCNKSHGGLSAPNRWEAKRPLRALTLGRRTERDG